MSREEAINILKHFVDVEEHMKFYAHATKDEVEAMKFAINYME